MRIGSLERNVRRRWVVRIAVLAVVVGLGIYGYSWWDEWRYSTSEAHLIAEGTTATGFVRVDVTDVSSGDNPPGAKAYFLGSPPVPSNVAASISIPGYPLHNLEPPYVSKPKQLPNDYTIVARDEQAGRCGVSVTVDRNPDNTASPWGRQKHSREILSPDQLESVRSGDLVLIIVSIYNCG